MDSINHRTPVIEAGGVISPPSANVSASGPGRMLYTKPDITPSGRLADAVGQMGKARDHAREFFCRHVPDLPLPRR